MSSRSIITLIVSWPRWRHEVRHEEVNCMTRHPLISCLSAKSWLATTYNVKLRNSSSMGTLKNELKHFTFSIFLEWFLTVAKAIPLQYQLSVKCGLKCLKLVCIQHRHRQGSGRQWEKKRKDWHAPISKQTSIPQLGVALAGLAGVCNKSERVVMPGGASGTICHQTYSCAQPASRPPGNPTSAFSTKLERKEHISQIGPWGQFTSD